MGIIHHILFSPGRVVATPGALAAFEEANEELITLLRRHLRGDWGNVCREDACANNQALVHGLRLLSSYTLSTGERIWLITEADRSSSTFLLPEEY